MGIDQIIGHMGRILVVDDEQSNLTLIKNYLKQQNQYDVHTFSDGEEAWASIKSSDYQFVIMGWKLRGVSGIAFLNRLRRLSNATTLPVLVSSGMINRNDFRILGEFPCTRLLEAPFTRGQFEKSIEHLLREKLWYKANIESVKQLVESMRGDGEKLEIQIKKVLKSSPNPAPLAVLAVRSMNAVGHFEEAKKILSELLVNYPTNVAALNEMAKIHCRNREYDRAFDLLTHARDLSPQNMARICMLGEVSLSLRDPFGAKRYFNEALEIDGSDEVARAGVTLSSNMLEFPANANGAALTSSFASLLNTIGIAFVRNGNFEKGAHQYQSAMMFLRDNLDFAKITFNLGLCYMRWGKMAEALPWFEKSHNYAGGKLPKSGNYVLSLKKSLNMKELERAAPVAKVVPISTKVSGFSATEQALRKAMHGSEQTAQAPSKPAPPSKNGPSIIKFDDDDLEERVGNTKGIRVSKDLVEQVFKTSVEDIENMNIEELEEIA